MCVDMSNSQPEKPKTLCMSRELTRRREKMCVLRAEVVCVVQRSVQQCGMKLNIWWIIGTQQSQQSPLHFSLLLRSHRSVRFGRSHRAHRAAQSILYYWTVATSSVDIISCGRGQNVLYNKSSINLCVIGFIFHSDWRINDIRVEWKSVTKHKRTAAIPAENFRGVFDVLRLKVNKLHCYYM